MGPPQKRSFCGDEGIEKKEENFAAEIASMIK